MRIRRAETKGAQQHGAELFKQCVYRILLVYWFAKGIRKSRFVKQ